MPRPIFQFLKRKPRELPDPLQLPKSALAWLHELPANDIIGRHQQVIRAFEDGARSGQPLDIGRVTAIEALDAELSADRAHLIRQYVENADSGSAVADRIWSAAYESSQGFIRVYRRAVDEAVKHAGEAAWKPVLPRLFARLFHLYGTDAKLRVL